MGMPASYGRLRDADGIVAKFGVEPTLIPDFLALVKERARCVGWIRLIACCDTSGRSR